MSRIVKDLNFCGRQPPLIFSNCASPHFGARVKLSLSWKKERKKSEVISLGLILAYKNSYFFSFLKHTIKFIF